MCKVLRLYVASGAKQDFIFQGDHRLGAENQIAKLLDKEFKPSLEPDESITATKHHLPELSLFNKTLVNTFTELDAEKFTLYGGDYCSFGFSVECDSNEPIANIVYAGTSKRDLSLVDFDMQKSLVKKELLKLGFHTGFSNHDFTFSDINYINDFLSLHEEIELKDIPDEPRALIAYIIKEPTKVLTQPDTKILANWISSLEDKRDELTSEFLEEAEPLSKLQLLDFIADLLIRGAGEYLIIKGGYLMSQILDQARATRDIDCSTDTLETYNQKVKPVLNSIGERLVSENLAESFHVSDIVNNCSGGLKVFDNGKRVVSIDVSLHPTTFGNNRYSFRVGENVNGFSIERMLADKISATLSVQRFRRAKDFYDIFIIVKKFSYSEQEVLKLIKLRNPEWNNFPFSEDDLIKLSQAWSKLSLTSIQDEVTPLRKPDFIDMMAVYANIVFSLKAKLSV